MTDDGNNDIKRAVRIPRPSEFGLVERGSLTPPPVGKLREVLAELTADPPEALPREAAQTEAAHSDNPILPSGPNDAETVRPEAPDELVKATTRSSWPGFDVEADLLVDESESTGSPEPFDPPAGNQYDADLDEPRSPSGSPPRPSDAPGLLKDRGLTAAWVARAEWFEQHAERMTEPTKRGRAWLVASELWSMVGMLDRARSAADRASKYGNPLAARQARQLAALEGDPAAIQLLSGEVHSAPTPAARSHAAVVCAEYERARPRDGTSVTRYFDQGARTEPSDPRPGLYKLARQLGVSPSPPSFRWAKLEGFSALERATSTISVLRGDSRASASSEERAAPVLAFLEATRALARADRAGAASALLLLAREPSLQRSATWLAAALYAPLSTTREKAAELLVQLLRDRASVSVRRSLGARALELGNHALLDSALSADGPPSELSDPSLSIPDRIAFGVLLGRDFSELEPWLDVATRHEELKPLADALYAVFGRPEASQAAPGLRLARLLGSGAEIGELTALLEAPSLPKTLARVLELEAAHATKQVESIAALVPALSSGEPEQQAAAQFAAGLLLEQSGKGEAAEARYAQALSSRHFAEAATRALLGLVPAERRSRLLGALAAEASDPERRALLSVEAALCAPTSSEAISLAESAFEACPSLPLPLALGQSSTLSEHSAAGALGWLGHEASLAESDYERALIATRQALLSGGDPQQAAGHLSNAWTAWPKDVALLELQERLTTAPLTTRAKNRELLAASLNDPAARARLLLEAARLYEQADADADATRVADLAQRAEPLARLTFERTAVRTPRVVTVKHDLEAELPTTRSPRQRAETCLRIAALEATNGNESAQHQWLRDATAHDPTSLRALLEYEQFALQRGQNRELSQIELMIAKQLTPLEGSAHALLGARFAQLELGWGASLAGLLMAARGPETPYWVARKLLPHAARGANDSLYAELLDVVMAQCERPLDRATLLLRRAEAATRMGEPGLALRHVEDAARLAPNHLVAQSLRAQLLAATDDKARTAEAHERVARLSGVPEHQTANWKLAADAWLEADDADRAQSALERAFRAAPTDDEVFERLLERYRQGHAKQKLVELLHTRLDACRRPEERTRLRLLEARLLRDFGDNKAARASLEALLAQQPDELQALSQLAELTEAEADTVASEQVLLQLARLNPDPETQADTYTKLGELYRGPLKQPQRALRCYQEVLRRRPRDLDAFVALIFLLVDLGQVEKALALISEQERLASADDAERAIAVSLARVQSRGLRDAQSAEQNLRRALNRWPRHPALLAGLVDVYQVSNNRKALSELSLHYCAEVKALLPDKPDLAQAIYAVQLIAELDNDECGATLANVAAQLPNGSLPLWPAAHGRAMSRNLDELLAPNPVSSALRTLLMQTHAVLDRAFELDLEEIGATPLTNPRVLTSFEIKAKAMGIACPQLFVISGNPHACLVTNNPSRVILGSAWVNEALPTALDFLAWRSLKLVQARVGIIERMRGQQLLATLEAFIGCFVDSKPALADPRLVEAMRRRLVEHLPKRLDDDLPVLARSVLSDLRERQLHLDEAIRRWVNRSALLATGDLRAALQAIATKQGEPVSDTPDSLMRLVRQSPEALDLVNALFEPGFLDACRMTKEPAP